MVGGLKDRGHIRALDGLRGAAVLAVFFFHALGFGLGEKRSTWVLKWLCLRGWFGVEVFFVLSGFLITTILLDAVGSSNYYKAFYVRRALRIWPLYYLVLSAFLLLSSDHYPARAQIWYWLNLSNLPTAFAPMLIGPLTHFWSLAIEEQFYFVWPALVRFVRPSRLAILCIVVIVGECLLRNFPAILAINARYPDFVYRFTLLRLDTLCAGALLAVGVKHWPEFIPRRAYLRGIAIVGIGAASIVGSHVSNPLVIRVGYTLLTLGACALTAMCLEAESLTSRVFSLSPLRTLGKYSYAFYVFHPFILQFLVYQHFLGVMRRTRLGHNVALLCLVPIEFGLTFAASWLSWHLFEGRFLALKKHFSYRPAPAGSSDLVARGTKSTVLVNDLDVSGL